MASRTSSRSPRRVNGSKKRDLQPTCNVCWADIDAPVSRAELEERLDAASLIPSVLIFSGRGHWVFFKLSRSVPLAEMEAINRGLSELLQADHCSNANRLARLPGAFHPVANRYAAVLKAPKTLHDPASLPSSTAKTPILQPTRLSEQRQASVVVPVPKLSQRAWNYIAQKPSKGVVDRLNEETSASRPVPRLNIGYIRMPCVTDLLLI